MELLLYALPPAWPFYKLASSLRGASEMGFLWTPFSLLLLLLREPACLRTQDHLSCPGRGLRHHPHQPIFGYPSPTQAH